MGSAGQGRFFSGQGLLNYGRLGQELLGSRSSSREILRMFLVGFSRAGGRGLPDPLASSQAPLPQARTLRFLALVRFAAPSLPMRQGRTGAPDFPYTPRNPRV